MLNLTALNTNIGTLYNAYFMFAECHKIQRINLLNHVNQIWGYGGSTLASDALNSMFYNDGSLQYIYLAQPTNDVLVYYAAGSSMFKGCNNLHGYINGQNVTYNDNVHVSAQGWSTIYAKTTNAPSNAFAKSGGFFWTSGASNAKKAIFDTNGGFLDDTETTESIWDD